MLTLLLYTSFLVLITVPNINKRGVSCIPMKYTTQTIWDFNETKNNNSKDETFTEYDFYCKNDVI